MAEEQGRLRARLEQAFVRALLEEFRKYGSEAIHRVIADRPHVFLRVVTEVVCSELPFGDDEPIVPELRRVIVRPGD